MIDYYIESASSYAGDIDWLFDFITILVGFWLIIAEVVFFYFIFKFRAKKGVKAQYITGEEKSQKKWIAIPHKLILVCDIFLVAFAIMIWYDVKQDLPKADEKIRVIGQQWAWTFIHPGPDGQLDTEDDIRKVDELRVKVDTLYHFELQSLDVLHCFSVPAFRLKQDTIPGRTIMGWFKPIREGEFDVQCAEMCGIGHGLMGGRIFIESKEDHEAWMASHQQPQTSEPTSLVASTRP